MMDVMLFQIHQRYTVRFIKVRLSATYLIFLKTVATVLSKKTPIFCVFFSNWYNFGENKIVLEIHTETNLIFR